MTIITSGDVRVVEAFYVVRDERGFWREETVSDDGICHFMDCIGDPCEAKRFDSDTNAAMYIEEHRGMGAGNATVIKVELTTKLEEVK